jgi:hypothetical protein
MFDVWLRCAGGMELRGSPVAKNDHSFKSGDRTLVVQFNDQQFAFFLFFGVSNANSRQPVPSKWTHVTNPHIRIFNVESLHEVSVFDGIK